MSCLVARRCLADITCLERMTAATVFEVASWVVSVAVRCHSYQCLSAATKTTINTTQWQAMPVSLRLVGHHLDLHRNLKNKYDLVFLI